MNPLRVTSFRLPRHLDRACLSLIVFAAAILSPACARSELPLHTIKLPPDFAISIYQADVPNARSMALGPEGTLFVGTRSEDKVYAIPDRNRDGRGDGVLTIASGLFMPNGVAIKDGDLYVAEVNRVLRYDDVEAQLAKATRKSAKLAAPAVVSDSFPSDTHHGWKFIRFGPDGRLYVPVGAPCNVCERDDQRYSSITRMNADGSGMEVFARGVRNTVGFDWDPTTGDLWFTDNGRDWLGDDWPPDELNHAPSKGLHFGFPYCHGRGVPDPDLGEGRECSDYTPAAQELGPHVAALGMRFYNGTQFPEPYRNQIFIAEHGSWNRSERIGYRVALVRRDARGALSYDTFAEGWLHDGRVWGRPVDVLVMPDGAMLVSDDHAGAIYRITYASRD